MKTALKFLWHSALLTAVVASGIYVDTHREWVRNQIVQIANRAEGMAAAETTASPSAGRHPLTESPPMTVADLDRLVGVGFTTDQVVSEVERRGVLRLPEPAERAHIQTLPSGTRLLDAMDSPKNLLDDASAASFGKRQGGGANLEQVASIQQTAAQQASFQARSGLPSFSVRQQQSAEYLRRLSDLNKEIASLQQKRAAMQRRGEITVSITMEIDRLQREYAAMVPPY